MEKWFIKKWLRSFVMEMFIKVSLFDETEEKTLDALIVRTIERISNIQMEIATETEGLDFTDSFLEIAKFIRDSFNRVSKDKLFKIETCLKMIKEEENLFKQFKPVMIIIYTYVSFFLTDRISITKNLYKTYELKDARYVPGFEKNIPLLLEFTTTLKYMVAIRFSEEERAAYDAAHRPYY